MITASIIHEVAEYVNGHIAKVVLNGSYEITSFEVKEATDGTVALNYIVPAADVPLITSIELADASGAVISSNNVNVPIASDTLMLQTIEVKEG